MKLPEDQLLSIVRRLSKYYGSDIAHDVAVSLLKRRNPLRKPEHWAVVRAAALARGERAQCRQLRTINFSDASKDLIHRLNNFGLI